MEIVHLYTKSSCSSSRKAKKYLEDNNIPFKEVSIHIEGVSREIVKKALTHSENGIDDVLVRTLLKDERFKRISTEEFITIVVENPRMLKTPIISQGHKMIIGYNDEEMTTFIPRNIKQRNFMQSLQLV